MSRPSIPPPAETAVRYGSRDGPAANPPEAGRCCPTCTAALRSARATYCSVACKQRAYRRRQPRPAALGPASLAAAFERRAHLTAHTIVYECAACGERLLGERRCADCNRFCRALGPGGPCPHCGEPVLLAELLPEGGATLKNHPA